MEETKNLIKKSSKPEIVEAKIKKLRIKRTMANGMGVTKCIQFMHCIHINTLNISISVYIPFNMRL